MIQMTTKGKDNTFRLVLTALFAALTAAATLAIRIPSPMNGYINLGDALVLACAWMLGPLYGTIAAGVGSMLADLISGYAAYAPGTLIIKSATALAACLLFNALNKKDADKHGVRIAKRIISGILGETIMVDGYFGYACLLMGKGLAAIRFGTGARLRASLGAGGLFFSCPFTEVMNGCIFGNGFIFAFNRHFLPCIFRAKKVNIFQAVTAAKRSASNRRHSVRDGDLRQIGAIGKCKIIDACYTVRNGIPHV